MAFIQRGNLDLDSNYVTFSITPMRLIIDYAEQWSEEHDLPSADLPNGFGALDVKHVEVRVSTIHFYLTRHV